ncbi:hypothetical protein TSOC_011454, partial [Tetrabaena socialis]
TVSDAVRQARTCLRLFREAAAAEALGGSAPTEAALRSGGPAPSTSSSGPGAGGEWPRRLILELPLPSQRTSFFGKGPAMPDLITLADESDYPGGEVQRFRVIRKLMDQLLEGYDAQFLGLLEDDADGVGLWAIEDITLIVNVTNATVPSLIKLLDGGYGRKVQSVRHTVIAVNPQWTGEPDSVGQPWQWGLRRCAAEVLEPATWEVLYKARMLRGSRGANGMLHRAWPHRWAVYPAAAPDARHLGECVLATPTRPESKLVLARLNEAKPAMQAKAKELGLEEPGWF